MKYMVTLSNNESTTATVAVNTVGQKRAGLAFRFPENDPGRSLINPSFFAEDSTVRNDARSAFTRGPKDPKTKQPDGTGLYDQSILPIWTQAAISFYLPFTDDNKLGNPQNMLSSDCFNTAGQVVAKTVVGNTIKRNRAISAIETANNPLFPNAINIYFVRDIAPIPALSVTVRRSPVPIGRRRENTRDAEQLV
jgi:hypothetical protein